MHFIDAYITKLSATPGLVYRCQDKSDMLNHYSLSFIDAHEVTIDASVSACNTFGCIVPKNAFSVLMASSQEILSSFVPPDLMVVDKIVVKEAPTCNSPTTVCYYTAFYLRNH